MRDRISALDGLRGVAALVVVVHHVLMTDAGLAAPYLVDGARPTGLAARLLVYTPLHLLWNGTVAVFVFFVLSGYVLALPAARGRGIDWWAYYPRRAVRLYLPVAAAVVLALGTAAAVPRHVVPGGSWWLNDHRAPGPGDVLNDLFLVWQPGGTVSVLWSLKWEVIFSILLPLYVRGARRVPSHLLLRGCVALALLSALPMPGEPGEWTRYLPMFGCGVLLAFRPPSPWPAERLRDLPVATVILVGLTSTWLVHGLVARPGHALVSAAHAIEVLLSAALVVAAASRPGFRAALASRPVEWLGSRSFSLYLVHEPVAVSTSLALGGRPPGWLTFLIAVPVALLIAEVFFRAVERPSIALARAAGRAGAGRVRRAGFEPANPAP
jgi:peptidoglycan/LPS O-acetylase OafA/YrhL